MRPPRLTGFRLAFAVSVLVGVFYAATTLYAVGLVPPHLTHRNVTVATATANLVVDAPHSLVGARPTGPYNYDAFAQRAALYGNLIATIPVQDDIARRMGIPAAEMAIRSRLTLPVQWAMRDPDEEQRANQILVATRPYKLELQSDPARPVLHVYAQAPSVATAEGLADTAIAALRRELRHRALAAGVNPAKGAVLDQLGPARGAVVNGQTAKEMMVLRFLVAFAISLALLVALGRVRRGWRAAADGAPPQSAPLPGDPGPPGPGGNWPHTTRVLPWMLAGFMAILWLVPFNAIQLSVSLPFDAKFDRIVLPLVFATWLLALSLGGPAAPRMRVSLIHVGIGIFVAIASLSIVNNALDLNQTLEFDLSFKKLTLLLSYSLLFVMIASSVRRDEVPSFLKYNLVLGLLCAVGTIWEYRFHYNVFYDLSRKLLPGIFEVGAASTDARDDIGRVMTFGPTDHPLEVTGLLTMALPIALVGILRATVRRDRILYGLAACVLLAAAVSTYRKSALLGPVAVVLTIAWFRRRELLRLAPLGFVALIAIHVLSPGAFGSIVFQLHPDHLGVATVSDRSSDYDAVRPDLWSHLAFGRGYGSYDHLSYRVLDSEMLSRLVDTGILGVLGMFLLVGCIVAAMRRTIHARHPVWSGPALAIAASAVAYLVFAFLFDVSSFPHVPYVVLSLAGLGAVLVSQEERTAAPAVAPREDAAELHDCLAEREAVPVGSGD